MSMNIGTTQKKNVCQNEDKARVRENDTNFKEKLSLNT